MPKATGTFSIKSWDEQPYAEQPESPKLTNARVVNTYSGDLDGEGTSNAVMFYASEAEATYMGYERVVATLGGRSGTFVLRSSGTYDGGVATTRWEIVPDSGTGDLETLSGNGGYVAKHGESAVPYELDYRLDDR